MEIEANEINELYPNDFPPLLKEIPDLPKKLFIRGKFPEKNPENSTLRNLHLKKPRSETTDDKTELGETKYLCVVGSRKSSQYGTDICEKIIGGLRGSNVVIVSGLALGIDTVAHKTAIDVGLPTVAVLGSGLGWDTIYPRANLELAKEILANGGSLISELPENYRPFKHNFPERNRIMAGLCHATLIIEAGFKSGTLITARLALDYNRDVFTVPGSVFSKHSEGPHMLISNGAMLVQNSEDVLQGLGLKPSIAPNTVSVENCTETEQKIYRALSEPMSRANLLQKIGGNTREVNIAISILEMKHLIFESGGVLKQT